jgi:hypothetical protein
MNSGEVTEPVAPEMSFEEFVAWCEANPYHDENGIDLSHLRENLKLTTAERMKRHEVARRGFWELKASGERYRTNSYRQANS